MIKRLEENFLESTRELRVCMAEWRQELQEVVERNRVTFLQHIVEVNAEMKSTRGENQASRKSEKLK